MSEQRPADESELIEFLRGIDLPAPRTLHESVQRMVAQSEQSRRGQRWMPRLLLRAPRLSGAVIATAVAALIVVLLVTSSGGGGPSSTLRAASALATAAATAPAPAQDSAHPERLLAREESIAFPYWGDSLGWRASGARRDRLQGRSATTVFYVNAAGERVGYTILGGRAPGVGGEVRWVRGVAFHELTLGGHPEVVWDRRGRLCIVASTDVPRATLLMLASA